MEDELRRRLEELEKEKAALLEQLRRANTGGGAAVAGDVDTGGGDFVGRDQHKQTVTGGVGVQINNQGTVNIAPDPLQVEEQRAEGALQEYLEAVWKRCQTLPLAALGGEEGRSAEVQLDQVYINLDTTDKEKIAGEKDDRTGREKERSVPVWEMAARHKRLVILGDPGSGKSTFVYHLASLLAGARLGWVAPDLVQPFDGLLPVLIPLRELAPQLGGLELAEPLSKEQRQAVVQATEAYLAVELARYDCGAALGRLLKAVRKGGCLLALDGLDEVPCDLRPAVRLAAGALVEEWQPARLLVTCRVRSYEREGLPGFAVCTLAALDEEKIGAFCQDWYRAQIGLGRFTQETAKQRADDLKRAAVDDLGELSGNPMLLTTMALIHQREIRLPKQRVRLYALAVDILLRRWQQGKAGTPAVLSAFLAG